jgi:hypothetical protein
MSGWGNLLLAFGWLKSFVLRVTKANRVPAVDGPPGHQIDHGLPERGAVQGRAGKSKCGGHCRVCRFTGKGVRRGPSRSAQAGQRCDAAARRNCLDEEQEKILPSGFRNCIYGSFQSELLI